MNNIESTILITIWTPLGGHSKKVSPLYDKCYSFEFAHPFETLHRVVANALIETAVKNGALNVYDCAEYIRL